MTGHKFSNAGGGTSLDGSSAAASSEVKVAMTPDGCTCGSRGICLACSFEAIKQDPFVESSERALRVLDGRGNVVELHGYSRKVK